MRILVLNSGSSSIKFRLVEFDEEPQGTLIPKPALTQGAVTGIGGNASLDVTGPNGRRTTVVVTIVDHEAAVRALFDRLAGSLGELAAIGHRVVHGGDRYVASTLITEQVEEGIAALSVLAPLHNPPCLAGIRAARAAAGPATPMVAVFDTAFHQTMPEVAKQYAIPAEWVDRHRIRRYGFHGIAHASLANGYAACTNHPVDQARLITLQLGNGCSVAAIEQGRSVDTSMGFTPLEGLVMGTRSGDVDPSIISYLAEREKVEAADVERWLNERSGLLALSGRSNDMREVLRAAENGDRRAQFTVELFCYRARKYLGAYLAVLSGADAVVFGGGIGENAPAIRDRICRNMEWCGLKLDRDRNHAAMGLAPGRGARISADDALIAAYVVAADEETWIAKETVRCLRGLPS